MNKPPLTQGKEIHGGTGAIGLLPDYLSYMAKTDATRFLHNLLLSHLYWLYIVQRS